MTIKEMLEKTTARYPTRVGLRFKVDGQWHTLTYEQIRRRAAAVSQILFDLGIRPGDRVALYRENAPDWPEIYFGIVGLAAIAVPIDAKLQGQEVSHIIRDSQSKIIFASAKHYALIRDIEANTPTLKAVIMVEGRNILPTEKTRLRYVDYEEALTRTTNNLEIKKLAYDEFHPKDVDLASIIYTSGTTGRPKGAMLSHGNFTANVQGCLTAMDLNVDDSFLLVLPLHHAFAFTTNLLLPFSSGSEISLVESLKTIGENMAEVRPTVLIGVPLLLEKMYGKIQIGIRKNKLAGLLMKVGGGKMVGRKILAKLGGRLRLIVTGGAPCDPAILHGWDRLGIAVREGYGLTESSPVLSLNPFDKSKPGTVGVALPNVELKIAQPNEKGVGEIIAKGPNIMQGYYKNSEATEAVLRDGWLYTGDLGFMDHEGYLTISGRKKSLIVNREGKNIYPEELESQVLKSPYIYEALALGYWDPEETSGERVGLIVVPDQDAVDAHSRKHKGPFNDRQVQQLIQGEVKHLCSLIAEYKRPRRIQIRYEEFEKTSTAKIKRYLYAIDTSQIK